MKFSKDINYRFSFLLYIVTFRAADPGTVADPLPPVRMIRNLLGYKIIIIAVFKVFNLPHHLLLLPLLQATLPPHHPLRGQLWPLNRIWLIYQLKLFTFGAEARSISAPNTTSNIFLAFRTTFFLIFNSNWKVLSLKTHIVLILPLEQQRDERQHLALAAPSPPASTSPAMSATPATTSTFSSPISTAV